MPRKNADAAWAAADYDRRPTFNTIVGMAPHPAQLPSLQYSPTLTPLPFTANLGKPASPTRTTWKQARQSTAPAAGERADDNYMAAPEKVGEMEGITPAHPWPPCSAAVPTLTSLPAFPPFSLASTPSQNRPRVASIMTACPQSPSSTL
jgi:hypothetical protein